MNDRQHPVKQNRRTRGRTPAGDAFSALAIQVLRLAALLTAAGDALAAPAGQSSARWQVLAAAEDRSLTVAQIARALGLARQSVQRVADLLAAEGLAVYEDNPADLRAKLLGLTARGRAMLAEIQKAQRAWANELGREIGEADLRRAVEIVERVTTQLALRERRE